MRSAAIILSVLAGVIILSLGDSPQALGDPIKLEMPKEAHLFRGILSAEVVKAPDKTNGWFQIKVIKVIRFNNANRTKLRTPQALTEVWKGKCAAILGVKTNMPELQVGDMVTVMAYTNEAHLRAIRVSKDKPVEAKPNGDATSAKGDATKVDERAEVHLKYAKKLLDQGMTEKAKARLKEIVEKFPLSKTREDARMLLEKLDKKAASDGQPGPGKQEPGATQV